MTGQRSAIGPEKSQNGKQALLKKIAHPYKFYFFSADWYKDQLTDEQLDALENPPKPKRPAAPINRRKHPRKNTTPAAEEDEE